MPYTPFGVLGEPMRPAFRTKFKDLTGGTLTAEELIIAGGNNGVIRSQNFVSGDPPIFIGAVAAEGWALFGDGSAELAGSVEIWDDLYVGGEFQMGDVALSTIKAGNFGIDDTYMHIKTNTLALFNRSDTQYGSLRAINYGGIGAGSDLQISSGTIQLFADTRVVGFTEVANGTGNKLRVVNGDGSHTWLGYNDGNNYITFENGGKTVFRDGSNNEKVRVDESGLYVPGGRLDMAGGYIDMGGGYIYYSGTSDPSLRFNSSWIGLYNGGWGVLVYTNRTEIRQQVQATSFAFYGDTDTYINNPSANILGFYTGGSLRFRMWSSGFDLSTHPTTGLAANAHINTGSNNIIYRSTSSLKYKPDWEYADMEALARLDLPTPIVWSAKQSEEEDAEVDHMLGFGVEHLQESLPEHVIQNQGDVYDPRSLIAILWAKIKRLEAQVEELQRSD